MHQILEKCEQYLFFKTKPKKKGIVFIFVKKARRMHYHCGGVDGSGRRGLAAVGYINQVSYKNLL